MNRTDKFLVGIAFLFFGMAMLSLLGFDDFLRLKNRGSAEKSAVAVIEKGTGDFRMKFHNEMAWMPGREKQKLVYDDAVFTGDGGKASLKMGESQVTLESNTLVVIRQVKSVKHLSLTYGTIDAKISKNDKVAIETADGKRFEITADESTKMSIQSSSKGTKIIAKSGTAKVTGGGQTQAQSLKQNDNIVFESPTTEPDPIQITAPAGVRRYTLSAKERIKFVWMYASGRPIKMVDDFTLEVSNDSQMKTLILKDRVLGQSQWEAELDSGIGEMYYRVKDIGGNYSEIRKMVFVKPQTPELVEPNDNEEFPTPLGVPSNVSIRVSGVHSDGRVWIQVSKNPEFTDLLLEKNLPDGQLNESFPSGGFYVRARGVYDQVTTSWSASRNFSVSEVIDEQRLARLAMPAKVIIPNIRYPRDLYAGEERSVQSYLRETQPFAKYFEKALIPGTDLMVSLRGITDKVKMDLRFPESWIRPGLAELVYHFEVGGRVKTEPRIHRFYVEMEAPNRVTVKASGAASWSPILFARGYEGLITSGTGSTQRFQTAATEFQTKLPAGHRYRFAIRALGESGIPISGWSSPVSVEVPMTTPPPLETAPPTMPIVRKMAEVEAAEKSTPSTLTAVKESVAEAKKAVYRLGAWIWAGMGENYYKVKQTIADAAEVNYENFKGPSAFLEAGFLAASKWGAAFSYKRTPGNIELDNKKVNSDTFVWDTFSLEALYGLPIQSKILGLPLSWGLRMGAQYHKFPFLYVEPLAQTVSKVQNTMLMGSLGAYVDTLNKRWNYHWLMRYQLPFQTSAGSDSEFTIKPRLAFDGSLGASYLFLNQWRTGFFWYGQWHDYTFHYRRPSLINSGQQSLFYSNFEVRLGFDF